LVVIGKMTPVIHPRITPQHKLGLEARLNPGLFSCTIPQVIKNEKSGKPHRVYLLQIANVCR